MRRVRSAFTGGTECHTLTLCTVNRARVIPAERRELTGVYHHSGSTPYSAGDSATGLLEPETRDSEALYFQRCTWCGTAVYHRLLCPVCRGSELRQERSEGNGTVRHSTVVHRQTPVARNVSLVEMAEGFVVRGRVVGSPATIHSGDRVRLSVAEDPVRGEPVFQLVDEPLRAWS